MTREEADAAARDFMDKFQDRFEDWEAGSLDEFLTHFGSRMSIQEVAEGFDLLSYYPEYGGAEFVEEADA